MHPAPHAAARPHSDPRRLAAAVAVLASTLAAPALAVPSFQGLGDLAGGQFASEALDVSADGTVVVGSGSTSDFFPLAEAFRWTQAGGIVSLGFIPPSGSYPSMSFGVSPDGSVVVGESSSPSLIAEAFRWDALGGMAGIGALANGLFSSARAASTNGGVVVGRSDTPSGNRAFRWTQAGGMVSLDLLPGDETSIAYDVSADGLVVVGASSTTATGDEAFRWTAATGMVGLGFLPGGFTSTAYAVSADGSIVVGTTDVPTLGGSQAFRWTAGGGIVGLGQLPGDPFAEALGVSDDGAVVVGNSRSGTDVRRAFIWDATNGMRLLRDVLVNEQGLDLTGWTLVSATGVSADGSTVVGRGTNPSGKTEAWIAKLAPSAPPDSDSDGIPDASDNCPFAANGGQTDTGGVGLGSAPDGIGDACQCGDVNGDGRVTIADATVIQRSLLVPPTATLAAPDRCDVNGSSTCSIADAVTLRRALLVPATAAIQQGCAPALP